MSVDAGAVDWSGLVDRGRMAVMGKPAVNVSLLSENERLDLLDRLWESLGRDPHALPLSSGQRAELDRRLDDLENEGPVGIQWDEVVAQIRARAR
ncbi:MAG TPA: addiction module protein [Polyangia bacterium]